LDKDCYVLAIESCMLSNKKIIQNTPLMAQFTAVVSFLNSLLFLVQHLCNVITALIPHALSTGSPQTIVHLKALTGSSTSSLGCAQSQIVSVQHGRVHAGNIPSDQSFLATVMLFPSLFQQRIARKITNFASGHILVINPVPDTRQRNNDAGRHHLCPNLSRVYRLSTA